MVISGKSAQTLRELVLAGASLEIDTTGLSAEAVRQIALALQPGTYLKVCNSGIYSAENLRNITLAKRGQVILA